MARNQAREIMQPARSFIVRCWPEQVAGPEREPAWRFAIEEVGPEQRTHGFADLAALMGYLGAQLRSTGLPGTSDRERD